MKLHSRCHGTIEYNENDVINFPKGLPGFENLKKFIIFTLEENKMFRMLHSIEDTEIGLIVVSPLQVIKDYQFELRKSEIKDLDLKEEKDAVVYNTVCLNKDIYKITVNLRAPIIINTKNNLGEQLILDNEEYNVKYPLIREE